MFYIGDSVRFFRSEIPEIFEICQIIFSQLLHYRVASPWEIDVNSRSKHGESEGGNLRGEQDAGRIKGNSVVECLRGWLIENNNKFSEKSDHNFIR